MIGTLIITVLLLAWGWAIFKNFTMKRRKRCLYSKHVVVTGGSSGIGQAVAELAAQEGAHVTILARNIEKLNKALEEIKSKSLDPNKQIITAASVDVSDPIAIEAKIEELEVTVRPIYMLVNCAGLAICGKIEDLNLADIKQMIEVNFLGTLYPIRSVLPRMKDRKEGVIVLTGSQLSLMGMFGMSVYSATKFALRGLAESVFQEAKEYGIKVSLCLPPDTDTPGLANEMKSKPIETQLMSDVAGLHSPQVVADQLLNHALGGKFFSCVGFESWILTSLCVGMSPFRSFFDVLLESAILGPLRLVSSFYICQFYSIIRKCHKDKKTNETENTITHKKLNFECFLKDKLCDI